MEAAAKHTAEAEGYAPRIRPDMSIGYGFTMAPQYRPWFEKLGLNYDALAAGGAQLPRAAAMQLLRMRMLENGRVLVRRIPRYGTLAPQAKAALMDWAYNAGPNAAYPKLMAAANSADYAGMRREIGTVARAPGLAAGMAARTRARQALLDPLVPAQDRQD